MDIVKGKVLIIDDSVLVRSYLTKIFDNAPHLEVCDVASNGETGFRKILLLKPDVVILDLEMNNGNGLYVLQQIEEHIPNALRPFVLIYSTRARYGDPIFKKAIHFGFCDFILKVEGSIEDIIPNLKKAFLPKVTAGVEAKKTRGLLHQKTIQNKESAFSSSIITKDEDGLELPPSGLNALQQILEKKKIRPKIIILGASTGGPQVIRQIVKDLGTEVNIPIVVIQHMPETFTKSFAIELSRSSGLPAYELRHNMSLEKNTIYVFPGGMHGRLNVFGNLFVYYSERKEFSAHPFKPSINLAIEYLIGSFHDHAIYVILSGMGKDGGLGAKALHNRGSLVIAQDKQTSAVWGMPGTVIKEKAADVLLSQDDIGQGIKLALKAYDI